MEFFKCPCPGEGTVMIDGDPQGSNRDEEGEFDILQCNRGHHTVELQCKEGRVCANSPQDVVIKRTNPIKPKEIEFQCGW